MAQRLCYVLHRNLSRTSAYCHTLVVVRLTPYAGPRRDPRRTRYGSYTRKASCVDATRIPKLSCCRDAPLCARAWWTLHSRFVSSTRSEWLGIHIVPPVISSSGGTVAEHFVCPRQQPHVPLSLLQSGLLARSAVLIWVPCFGGPVVRPLDLLEGRISWNLKDGIIVAPRRLATVTVPTPAAVAVAEVVVMRLTAVGRPRVAAIAVRAIVAL